MGDHNLIITPEVTKQLSALCSEPKFHKKFFYPGAPTEEIRIRSEGAVNAMLELLLAGLRDSPQKSFVLSHFLQMLKNFEYVDSEEREQACAYCEQVMNILQIKSSDGLLNKWLYGFDPDDHLLNQERKKAVLKSKQKHSSDV